MSSTQRRRSVRLPHHDYLAGIYFVTICTAERRCLFGQVVGGVMVLNDLGHAVQAAWEDLARRFPHVDTTDAFVVMPNHVHGNIGLVPRDPPRPLGAVMGAFKGAVTAAARVFLPGVAVWQRSYYERVIRNEYELDRTREYIVGNPGSWDRDAENPFALAGADSFAELLRDLERQRVALGE